ncbi:MAG: hypothetical protein QW099_01335 [Candidatus Bathyarchaeia archaeon]
MFKNLDVDLARTLLGEGEIYYMVSVGSELQSLEGAHTLQT